MAQRQCDLGYSHDEPDPEPIVIDDGTAEAAVATGAAEVEIAKLETDRDIELAKIQNRAIDAERDAALAAMQARIDVLEQAAIPPAPPEPEPIVIPVDPPPSEPPTDASALPDVAKTPKGKPSKGWWSNYS